MVNVINFEHFLVIRAGNHKMLVRMTNSEDPDQTFLSILIWVCTVCLSCFGRQIVFKNSRTSTIDLFSLYYLDNMYKYV